MPEKTVVWVVVEYMRHSTNWNESPSMRCIAKTKDVALKWATSYIEKEQGSAVIPTQIDYIGNEVLFTYYVAGLYPAKVHVYPFEYTRRI